MKTYSLNILFLLFFSVLVSAQEAEIRIITQQSWPPGKMVPVKVEIKPGEAEGFARFYHRLPNGFTAENISASGADFFWDNNQVNYVWTSMPLRDVITITYKVAADKLLSGSFRISGRFDYIVEGKHRLTAMAEPVIIKLDRHAEVSVTDEPEQEVDNKQIVNKTEDRQLKENELPVNNTVKLKSNVDFRIQVSISSNKFSQNELENRIGVKLKHGIKVMKTASMYKYQSGSFSSYDKAADYLKELKDGGLDDAFIVAFKDGVQISIKEAEELLK